MQIVRQLMAKLFAIQLPRGIPLAQSQSQSFRFHFEECPSTNRTKAAVLMYACISSACSLQLYAHVCTAIMVIALSGHPLPVGVRLFAWPSNPNQTSGEHRIGQPNPFRPAWPWLQFPLFAGCSRSNRTRFNLDKHVFRHLRVDQVLLVAFECSWWKFAPFMRFQENARKFYTFVTFDSQL